MNGLEIMVSEGALNGLTNFTELMAFAKESIAPYENLLVTEEELSTAKDVVARMRKVGKAASDLRIRTEKEHAAKIELTVRQLKEITQTFNDAAAKIDTQVKKIVNDRKAAKRNELKEYFQSVVGIAGEFVAFESIEDEKWQNATVTVEAAKKQIDEIVRSFQEDTKAVKSIAAEPGIKAALEREFKNTLSLAKVLQLKPILEESARVQREQEEKRRAELEAAKAAQEAQAAQQAQEAPAPVQAEPELAKPLMPEANPIIRHTFWVEGTAEQFRGLKQFLIDNNMKYGRA